MKLYSIKNWHKHYEKSQTRKVKLAQWVPLPVKHDGKGFRRLMAMKNGIAIYGAWVLLVQIAAKCEKRGVLADDEGPLTPEDFAIKTGCSAASFSAALEVLTSPSVGWMLVADYHRDTTTLDEHGISLQLQDRQDKTYIPPLSPKGERGVRFQSPSIEEVQAYCQERGNAVDAETWHAHYTANGWRVGKNPMKDWRASVRTWERNSSTAVGQPFKQRVLTERELAEYKP